MLVKLLKQEMKSKIRVMLLIYEILAAATLLVGIVALYNKYVHSRVSNMIYVVSGSLYIVTIVVLVITSFIYLCVSFYQSMYSAQGYLTHTLPVKTTAVLNTKIAASFVYMVLTAAVVLVLVGINGLIVDGIGIGELFRTAGLVMQNIYDETGINGAFLIGFVIIIGMLGCLDALLLFFAGSSIGQLFHRSKGAWGIAAGIGLYYVTQIITLVIIVLVANAAAAAYRNHLTYDVILGWVMPGMIAVFSFWAVVYYIISRIIVQKHLNLE